MEQKLNIVIAGDWAPIRNFAPLMSSPHALDIYGDVLNTLQNADMCIANLEAPLAGKNYITKSGAAFSGSPEHVAALAPFQVVTMANNHTFDTGIEGFQKTIELLDKAGIKHVGAGMNAEKAESTLMLEAHGTKLAICTMSEGEDMLTATTEKPGVAGWDVNAFCQRIQNAAASGATVIAIVHCGLEYYPYPPAYVYEAFEKIAKAGTSLIIGHHVHVPQGMCFFGETPAFFSLGNFVFYQENTLLHRKTGYMVQASIMANGELQATPVPYRIQDNGIRMLTSDEKAAFEALFAELSRPLATHEEASRAWNACLAWYGIKGYCQELEKIRQTLLDNPPKGAAMLRNRLNCMQHKMHWTDGMNRIINGTIADADASYLAMVNQFFTQEIEHNE